MVADKDRRNVEEGLDRAFSADPEKTTTVKRCYDLETAKVVVFSDHHRGTGDGADDFRDCLRAYSAALGYYLEAGYTLVLLGDVEDLWECRPGPVIQKYRNNLLLEAEFLQQGEPRYYRVYGNHDDLWRDSKTISKYFQAQMPGHPEITVTESLRLTLKDRQGKEYRFFLVHGHQGTMASDRFGDISRFFVRYVWRPLQRVIKCKSTTPAKDERLRSAHDVAMYSWALEKWKGNDPEKAVLIAGHTHQPVFSSKTFVMKLKEDLARLRESAAATPLDAAWKKAEVEEEIAKKRAELEFFRAEHGDSIDDGDYACYFNTGCCSFGDGDVTALEISDGEIKLVRWPDDLGRPKAKVLEGAKISKVFERLETLAGLAARNADR